MADITQKGWQTGFVPTHHEQAWLAPNRTGAGVGADKDFPKHEQKNPLVIWRADSVS